MRECGIVCVMELLKIFKRAYDRPGWFALLDALFGTRFEQLQYDIPVDNADVKDAVEEFNYIGGVDPRDADSIGIYEIKAKPKTQLHRNRVELRKMVAKACHDAGHAGALAAYHTVSDPKHWRLSLVIAGDKQDEAVVSKRFTYLVGEEAQTRTIVKRFTKLLDTADGGKNTTLEKLAKAFSVEPLNKEFYEKIYEWYVRAKKQVAFPNDDRVEKDEHGATSLIRLLTRLMFVWFMREKGLVQKDLFRKDKLEKILHYCEPSSFYKAVLQNLFFATLNVERKHRVFRTEHSFRGAKKDRGDTRLFRYHDLVQDEKGWLDLFAKTPFLNGGLFECLDRKATAKEQEAHDADNCIRLEPDMIRIDGFSEDERNILDVPNALFFGEENAQTLGIIDIFSQYQFTAEESTPLDVEVALDPELLGRVFENLLASYNPETQATARKTTGSFYTPREVVSYMVDESLMAYFKQKLPPPPQIPQYQ